MREIFVHLDKIPNSGGACSYSVFEGGKAVVIGTASNRVWAMLGIRAAFRTIFGP